MQTTWNLRQNPLRSHRTILAKCEGAMRSLIYPEVAKQTRLRVRD
jgi:hypothetical protein